MRSAQRGRSNAAFICCAAVAALLSSARTASAVEHVDLQLVLATDVSGSINHDELRLERQGIATAFLDPDVIRVIESGALGRIAVAMLDFSSPGFGKTVIGWRIVHDRASAAAFARAILAIPRTVGDRTSISNALELGAQLMQSSGDAIVATRKVIDIAGDGPNNDGKPLHEIRERVLAQGIAINGLSIMDETANGYFPGLDRYYQGCVIGGRASFAIVVKSFRDFGSAMRQKLILEISADETAIRNASTGDEKSDLLTRVAIARGARVRPDLVLRPAHNEYSLNCHVPDSRVGSGKR